MRASDEGGRDRGAMFEFRQVGAESLLDPLAYPGEVGARGRRVGVFSVEAGDADEKTAVPR